MTLYYYNLYHETKKKSKEVKVSEKYEQQNVFNKVNWHRVHARKKMSHFFCED